jgi:hypothetical protein
MTRFLKVIFRFAVSYLLASATYLLYFKWPYYEGHPDAPFTAFPDFLVWSPIAPYFLFHEFLESPHKGLLGLLVFGFVLAGSLWFFFRRGPANA